MQILCTHNQCVITSLFIRFDVVPAVPLLPSAPTGVTHQCSPRQQMVVQNVSARSLCTLLSQCMCLVDSLEHVSEKCAAAVVVEQANAPTA